MRKEKIYIFDTTLRDGAQTEGVDFSLDDKTKIASSLSEIGIDYIKVAGQEQTRQILIFLTIHQSLKVT